MISSENKVFAISLLSTGCYLSCYINDQPVLVGARRFDRIASLDNNEERGLYSDYTLKDVFCWAHRLAKASFPDQSDCECVISSPTYTTNTERKKLISSAIECNFTRAIPRHSNVAVASLYIPSVIGNINARCLVVCLDGEEISSYITELGDGVHETLAVSRQQLEIKSGKYLPDNICEALETVCGAASKDSKLPLNEHIDYCLITGHGDKFILDLVRNKLSELTSISRAAILYDDKAIALGNAIVGGVLQGSVKETLFLDANSHSVFTTFMRNGNVSIMDNESQILCIARNTAFFPTKRNHCYQFYMDANSSVLAYVFEVCRQNENDFRVSDINCFMLDYREDAAGSVEIEIVYDIDANCEIVCNAQIANNHSSVQAEVRAISTMELQEIESSNVFCERVEILTDTCTEIVSKDYEITNQLDALVELQLTSSEVIDEHRRTLLLNENELISVRIPAGVEEGTKIKVVGKGNFQPGTGKWGDLYLKIVFHEITKEEDWSADDFIEYAKNTKSFNGSPLFNRVLSYIQDVNSEKQQSSNKKRNVFNALSSVGAIGATATGLGGVAAALSMARLASLSNSNKSVWSNTEINQIREIFDTSQNGSKSLTARLGQPLGRFIRRHEESWFTYSVFQSNNRGFNLVTLMGAHQIAKCFTDENTHSLIKTVVDQDSEEMYSDLLSSLYPFEVETIKGIRLVKDDEARENAPDYQVLAEIGAPYRFDFSEQESFYAYKLPIPHHSDY